MTVCYARLTAAFITIALGVAAPATVAYADVASDMTQELVASGVPGAQVQVGTPASPDEAEINPDAPTMSVARVTINAPVPSSLTQVLQTSGTGAMKYTTLPSSLVLWELAVLEAAKHRIAAGTSLAGVTIKVNVAGQPPSPGPYVMLGLGDISVTAPPPETMSVEAIRSQVQASLPPWAAISTVQVAEDAASQRVVALSLSVSALFLAAHDVRVLSNVLAKQQAVLTERGANIGRCIVRVTDARTGDPLYVSGDDVLLGTRSYWDSPLVAGFIGPGLLIGEPLGSLTGVDTTPANSAVPRP